MFGETHIFEVTKELVIADIYSRPLKLFLSVFVLADVFSRGSQQLIIILPLDDVHVCNMQNLLGRFLMILLGSRRLAGSIRR